jgi:DNA-binding CsgD family transcriptional regulator
LSEPEAALKALAGVDAAPIGAEDKATIGAVRGAALVAAGRVAEGAKLLDGLAEHARELSPQLRADIDYQRATACSAEGRADEAQQLLERALPLAEHALRGRIFAFLGWLDFHRESYAAAARQFVTAFDILGHAADRDPLAAAVVLGGLSTIAADTIDLGLGRIVRREYAAFAWTGETAFLRFSILGDLANLSLLEGELEQAWVEQNAALGLSVDTPYYAQGLIGAAHLSRLVGDRFAAGQYLGLAGSLLVRGGSNVDPIRRHALLAFLVEAAPEQQHSADAVLALFERTQAKGQGPFHVENDRRAQAYELLARGRHARRAGDRSAARRYLQQSLDLWLTLAQRRYAAIAAFDLAEVTREQQYAALAREQLRHAPLAVLTSPSQIPSVEPAPLVALTPSERRVLAQLALGKRSQEIADTFDRSIHTINNQTRKIFLAFKVTSRASLIVDCKRLGILEMLQAEAEAVPAVPATRAKRGAKRKR